jgi:hypothetical protein
MRTSEFIMLGALIWSGLAAMSASAQVLVFSTGDDVSGPSALVVFPDLGAGIDGQTPIYVLPTLPDVINPHGFTLIGPTTAVAGKIPGFQTPRVGVDIIDIATASLIASFNPGGANNTDYKGLGTLIVNPAGSHVLLASGTVPLGVNSSKLWVVPTPLSEFSVASEILSMPGNFGTAQTHAIAFDSTSGRAYVAHTAGVTAIDPPYAAIDIAYTITLPTVFEANGGLSRSIALSPDSSTLLLTSGGANPGQNLVTIIHAPFSGSSAHEELTVDHALQLRAIAFTPDGSRALAVDAVATAGRGQVFAIAAPFSASSAVEWLRLPVVGQNNGGFEEIDISPDGSKAALGGGCAGDGCPLVVLHAPFTETGVTAETMNVPPFGYPYGHAGRGAGTVHFWPTPTSPQPQISIDRLSLTEGNSGTRLAVFTVSLSNPSTQTVSVDYATQDSTAQAGSDYTAVAGTLVFAPGQTRRTISVPIIGDGVAEPDERFHMGLSNSLNASLLPQANQVNGPDGACIIVNDDNGSAYIATDPPLSDASVGAPYAQGFTAVGTTTILSWGVADPNAYLPGGLAMDAPTGVLSGVPAHAGSYYFQVYLAGLNISREYHLIVRSDRIFADGFD